MKTLLTILALLTLSACGKPAESTTQVGVEFVVHKLFTHEGCTLYRFYDGGYARYYTNCSGSTSWTESCGKNCSRPNGID